MKIQILLGGNINYTRSLEGSYINFNHSEAYINWVQ